MKLSEMKQVLAECDIQLTKSLGQNFLHDANQLRRIVEKAELTAGDKVLEIGPGLGPLTDLLLARAAQVFAIETDVRLVKILRQRFSQALASPLAAAHGRPQLELLQDDALDLLRREKRNWEGWKLVANLPYSVASPILIELAEGSPGPDRMVATLQIEVARRLVATASDPDYGILSLLVQVSYLPQGWFKIPATCFFPSPGVDSACISLVRRKEPLLEAAQRMTYSRLVKLGFSQRRKMLMKRLKSEWKPEKVESLFRELGISAQARAEEVSLEQFVALARLLHGKN
jgi:16S rRNA (adenine1518-N6/adenine1519-N6)-dimethyltransferase